MEDSISSLSPVTCGNLRSCIHWYWFVKDIWAACWIKSMDQSLWGLRNVVWVTEKCKFISAISALISTSKKISRASFPLFFLPGSCFTNFGSSQDSLRRKVTIFHSYLQLPPACKYSDQTFASDMTTSYFIPQRMHVITRLLSDVFYPPRGISFWLNINCIVLYGFMSDLITVVSHRQEVDSNSLRALLTNSTSRSKP